jgi:hypothetical protein
MAGFSCPLMAGFGYPPRSTLDFVGTIVEWVALQVIEGNGKQRLEIDDEPTQDLFRQNPGVYLHLLQVTKTIKDLGIGVANEVDLKKPVGVKALLVWLAQQIGASMDR